MVRIAPSFLAADFAILADQLQQVQSAEMIHLDVMDGHFVPNISFGQPVIRSIRQRSDHYFDTHLMIEKPEHHLEQLVNAGADRLTIHAEISSNTGSVIESINDLGVDSGVAVNPNTDIEEVVDLLTDVDSVLVMGVQPGFGGQEFIQSTVKKIERLDEICDVEIAVDGGVNSATGKESVEAGADTLVIGSSLFKQEDIEKRLDELRTDICETGTSTD